MVDPEVLVRPNIKALKPYRSARQDHAAGLLLDANENSFGSVISFDGVALNRYPDPHQVELRTRLARINSVSVDNIFIGVGSDEIIDLLIRVFCEPPGDAVLLCEPTYGMYRVAANIQGVNVRSCLLTDDFQIDVDTALKSVSVETKIIFCCSPNNPTGNLLRQEDILRLCREISSLIVVDEAYLDFSLSKTLAAWVQSIPNLVVLRTLSKAWGLAGIRLGYCIATPLVIGYLMKVKPPYNINALTSLFALQGLQNADRCEQAVRNIIRARVSLSDGLRACGVVDTVFSSDANFLLVRFKNAKSVYLQLAARGIIVRDRSSDPKLENCLRITVGTRTQNDTLLKVLQEITV